MESVCWGNSTVGSNPTLSARISFLLSFYFLPSPGPIASESEDERVFVAGRSGENSKRERHGDRRFHIDGVAILNVGAVSPAQHGGPRGISKHEIAA